MEITKKEFNEFHHKLVNEIAQFLQEHDAIEGAWSFTLTVDDLDSLRTHGEWTPMNDSYMGITNTLGEELIWEM